MELRGIHIEARSRAVPALERLIREVAPALGLNWIVAEINSGFAFRTHPEVAGSDPMTADEARRLAAAARETGLRLVPMYNCLGHQSWGSRVGGLLNAHPEFNESPDISPDSEDFYAYSWCPNHPDVNPIVFDLFDELLDAFESDAFHVGMDEVFILGHCPRCRGASPAELFAKAVNDYHGHLVGKRGVQMQMWGDRLLPRSLGFSHWESSENHTEGAADLIPKDILICDWHYHLLADYPSVRYFLDKGFPVCTSGWKEPPAIRSLLQVSREAAHPNLLGYLATTWCGVGDFVSAIADRDFTPKIAYLPDVVNGVELGAALAQD